MDAHLFVPRPYLWGGQPTAHSPQPTAHSPQPTAHSPSHLEAGGVTTSRSREADECGTGGLARENDRATTKCRCSTHTVSAPVVVLCCRAKSEESRTSPSHAATSAANVLPPPAQHDRPRCALRSRNAHDVWSGQWPGLSSRGKPHLGGADASAPRPRRPPPPRRAHPARRPPRTQGH